MKRDEDGEDEKGKKIKDIAYRGRKPRGNEE